MAAEGLFIVGLGGHAGVVAAAARALGWWVEAFVDPLGRGADPAPRCVFGRPMLSSLTEIPAGAAVFVAIGRGRHREESVLEARRCVPDARWPNLIHPTARVDTSAVGTGAFVAIGAILAAGVTLGEGAIVNSGAIVDHDGRIGRYAHVGPGAVLAGNVAVGDHAFVATGARVIPGVAIGAAAIVGAGAVVIRDVHAGATVVGIPARPIEAR